jgi:hypothetical protein
VERSSIRLKIAADGVVLSTASAAGDKNTAGSDILTFGKIGLRQAAMILGYVTPEEFDALV